MKFSDLFTYRDASGKRRLRTYVKAAIFILIALIALWAVSYYQQSRTQQAIEETKSVGLPSLTPTVREIATSAPAPTAVAESCPTDPEDWTLKEIAPGDVLLRIEPACIYEGLERTVAFALGITEGYSRQAAADALGFEKLPMVRLKQVTIANPNGPLLMDVGFAIDVPDFTEWYFNDKLRPSTSMALQGCFRTYTIAGNEKQNWDENGYPVVCRVSSDNESMGATICFGDVCYTDTSPIPTKRGFALFGYAGNGRWDWLGTEKDTFIELDPQTMSNDRSTSAQLQGVGPWEAAWLKLAYGLDMRPLPENWKSFEDKANLQQVLDALNAYSAGGTSP
jgi:hypothetical protein